MASILWDRNKEGNWPNSKTLYSGWKRKIAIPISKIDEYAKHSFREHNQEADHWANLGAEGQRKTNVDRQKQ